MTMFNLQGHTVEVPNNKGDPSTGTRRVFMGPVIYLERSDFREVSSICRMFLIKQYYLCTLIWLCVCINVTGCLHAGLP